ncbi:MAG: indole-3-glycerol-phosphate synthase [Candidatus Nanohaloarchaea archaeon]
MSKDTELASQVDSILKSVEERNPPEQSLDIENVRSFPEAVQKAKKNGRSPVISEIKPTSPTTEGVKDLDPVKLAGKMEDAGATAISVLTEEQHFGGSTKNLRRAREAVDIPVLRKDFILNEEELDRVKADIVLLIARFIDNLEEMIKVAHERGFQTLVEVHTKKEMREAVNAGAEIIGVNNRDLSQLEVNLNTFEEVAKEAPQEATLVAESGIKTSEGVERMMEAGADAMLIGTAIMDGKIKKNIKRFTNRD